MSVGCVSGTPNPYCEGSNPSICAKSIKKSFYRFAYTKNMLYYCNLILRSRAGVARRAHNPKVGGANPSSATN